MKILKNIVFVVLVALLSQVANAQSIKELQEQTKKSKEKLAETQKLLKQTNRSKKGAERQISLLSKSIKESNNVIFSINSEIDGLNRDITSLGEEKERLAEKLELIKKEYAHMISKNEIYRRQFSPVLFIFSSKNFAQGIRRARYVAEFARYRKKQAEDIKKLTASIMEKETILQEYVAQKSVSLHDKEAEKQKLDSQKQQQDKLLKKYNRQEREYNKTIKQEQQRQKNLNELIRKKVAEENRRKAEMARKAAEEEARKKREAEAAARKAKEDAKKGTAVAKKDKAPEPKPVEKPVEKPIITESEYKEYKADMALTGSFARNRGNLPMPVSSGAIHRRFGRQTNPLTNAIENNSGIYIKSPEGMEARAVFEGTVFEVMYEPGSGYIVWVTHGSYSTVYAQLSLFYVKKGDKVRAGQKIGKIAQKNNITELNFYILNENATYENPENWLVR